VLNFAGEEFAQGGGSFLNVWKGPVGRLAVDHAVHARNLAYSCKNIGTVCNNCLRGKKKEKERALKLKFLI